MGNKVRSGCCCLRKRQLPSLEGKYDVLLDDVLGQGTFATVYKAKNKSTRQIVAVKIIDKAGSRRDLLNTEIWILQHFGTHPNVVNLYDMYENEFEVQLVMELMLGGELFDLLDEHGPYTEADASKYLKSMASGLAYLHTGKVCHRDLKPENLLLTCKGPTGVLKISDFGLAKILIAEDFMTVACGTWIYCAPEVLLLKLNKTGTYDIKCDVFSVGCILYLMLGGYHPFDFDGSDDEEMMQECIVSDTWDFDDPIWNEVSSQAKDLMEHLLKWDPKERISAQELVVHPWTQGHIFHSKPLVGEDLIKVHADAKTERLDLDLADDVALPLEIQAPEKDAKRPSACATEGATAERTEGGRKLVRVEDAASCVEFPMRLSRVSANAKRHFPKKHMPHAGSRTENTEIFRGGAAPLGLQPKGVGTTFNCKKNETRWEKFNLAQDQQRSSPDDVDGRKADRVDAEAVILGVEAELVGLVAAPETANPAEVPAANALQTCEIVEKVDSRKSPASASSSPKAKSCKVAVGNTRQFASVAEWKAKQAPKLVKEAVASGKAGEPLACTERKAKSVKKSKVKPKSHVKKHGPEESSGECLSAPLAESLAQEESAV